MARLGELLVSAGVLTTEQVEKALRAQVMWGARLGTNLIELGLIDLDVLTTYLGRLHNLPAALARHFEKVDRELQLLLHADMAEMYCCIPLVRTGPRRDVVLAVASPLAKKPLARIADELCVEPDQLIVSIAAELRVRYQLERVYGINRPARFMRAPGGDATPFPSFDILEVPDDSQVDHLIAPRPPTIPPPIAAVDEVEELGEDDLAIDVDLDDQTTAALPNDKRLPALADLDDLPADLAIEAAVPREVEEEASSGRARRKYVRTIADDTAEPERALARISIRRVAQPPPKEVVAAPSNPGKTLGEATRAIRRATDRERIAELSMEALFRFAISCHAATLLVLRGPIATSWKGFSRSGASTRELTVPLDQPGLVPRALHRNHTTRGPASDLGPIDQLLMDSLGHKEGELIVVPVSISGEVMCVIAMVTEVDASSATPESIAAAAGAAFARLMRDASR